MAKFKIFKGVQHNAPRVLSMLTGVSCAVLIVGTLGGCTVGMFGDMGGEPEAQIEGKTYHSITPESVQIKDLIPEGGDSVAPATITNYESTIKGDKVAEITVKSGGYGDLLQKNIDKLKDKAAKLGANLIVITSRTTPMAGGLSSIEGTNTMYIKADAYHLQ